MLYAAKGDNAQAVTFQSRARAASERNLALDLAARSDGQKLAYLALLFCQTDFTLSLPSQAAQNDPPALDLAFTTQLRRKRRVPDAMVDTSATLRRHAVPGDQKLLDQLAGARSQLSALTLKVAGAINLENYLTRLKPFEEQIEALEGEHSSRSVEFRAQSQLATLAAVQATLPAGGALVELTVFTPIVALVDERNNYLVERYAISYLTSGRDLLQLLSSKQSKNAPLIVANPDFSGVAAVAEREKRKSERLQGANRELTQIDSTEVIFSPLPDTEREALAIKAALPEASVLLRKQTTEAALKRYHAPSLLHITTNKLYLNDQETPPAEMRGGPGDNPLRISDWQLSKWTAKIKDPLLRSGLAQAGVNERV
jgi:hypothetical protein